MLVACSSGGAADATTSSTDTDTHTTPGSTTVASTTGATDASDTTSTTPESSSEAEGSSTALATSEGTSGSDGSTTGSEDGAWMTTCPAPGGVQGCITPVATAACNPYTQDCAEGSKCAFNDGDLVDWFFLEETCLPIVGDGAAGEPCSYADGFYLGPDDCGPDAWCNNVDYATMIGECVARCSCDSACEAPGSICQHSGYAPYCGYLCDPLLADAACPEGWYCRPEIGSQTADSAGAFTCKPQYDIPTRVGEPSWCPAGWTRMGSPECVQLCSPDGEFSCDDGFVCNQLEDSPLGFCPIEIGRCDPA